MTLRDEVRALRGEATPGPWRTEAFRNGVDVIAHASLVVASAYDDDGSSEAQTAGNAAPDAALVAAAPTLAEKLERALELLAGPYGADQFEGWDVRVRALLSESLLDGDRP